MPKSIFKAINWWFKCLAHRHLPTWHDQLGGNFPSVRPTEPSNYGLSTMWYDQLGGGGNSLSIRPRELLAYIPLLKWCNQLRGNSSNIRLTKPSTYRPLSTWSDQLGRNSPSIRFMGLCLYGMINWRTFSEYKTYKAFDPLAQVA